MSKFAMKLGWSDVDPYEVVRVVSERTLEVREMKATLLNGPSSGEPDALQFSPGGFCGHMSGTQRWDIQPDPERPVIRIRKGKRGWKSAGGSMFQLGDKPRKFYDYNF